MIVKGTHVLGLNVLTVNDGRNIDKVNDLIYDPKEQRVKALLVDQGGWFSDAKVIMMEDVKSIGLDAVIIESIDSVHKASDIDRKIAHIAKHDTYLTKARIVTEDGTELGRITDIYFHPDSGKVDELEVSEGTLKDMQSGKRRVSIDDIVTIGQDATIVKGYVKDQFADQANHQGMQGAIHTAKENTKETFQQARTTATNTMNNSKSKTTSAAEKAKLNTAVLASKAKLKAQDTFNTTQDKLNSPETKEKIANLETHTSNIIDTINSTMEETNTKIASKIHDAKSNPTIDKKIADLKSANATVGESMSQNTQEATSSAQTKVNQVKSHVDEQKKKNAAGQYVTKAILSPLSDELIASRGDMITYEMIYKAESEGVLDQILNNMTNHPMQ